MNDRIFLHGLALQNYRGIGPQLQNMGPFRPFNIFIGANNSGKSSVLNFISKFLPLPDTVHASHSMPSLDVLEKFNGSGSTIFRVGVPYELVIAALTEEKKSLTPYHCGLLENLCESLAIDGFLWLQTKVPFDHNYKIAGTDDNNALRNLLTHRDWQILWSALTGSGDGNISQHWIPQTLNVIAMNLNIPLPKTRIVPAIRQIGSKSEGFKDYSGSGLIDRLAEIQNPDHDKRHERELFDKINDFLRDVTDRPDAEIEVPYNREHILVHMDEKNLPLSSLGTGIQEVIMIAAFCTISEKQIVCLEEPEIHLHPLLQRKLINYLRVNTSNQYFIATHSAAFIDVPDAAIFHVALDAGQTVVRSAKSPSDRFAICMDLGHRASDLLQTNAVIWVEGPSDRIYLRHWIEAYAPDLVEGVHYSIMFYGGRLLSHLSADDDEVSDFISLKMLNRNSAIVIDSDKQSAHAKINPTKVRVVSEFETGRGVAWVTKGREIENYVPHEVLQAAVKRVYESSYLGPASGGRYVHALHFKRKPARGGKRPKVEERVDKVKVAREVCTSKAELDVLDLKKNIKELVQMIRDANK